MKPKSVGHPQNPFDGLSKQTLHPSDILNSGIQGTADPFHLFHTSGTGPAPDGLSADRRFTHRRLPCWE
jgi:hypothetical protein